MHEPRSPAVDHAVDHVVVDHAVRPPVPLAKLPGSRPPRPRPAAAPEPAVDLRRGFVCPTLTPLYYTEVYRELEPAHRLRYNQLNGLFSNELISFFESTFAPHVLGALERSRRLPAQLRSRLGRFAADEREHIELWRRLNRASAPGWYEGRDHYILRVSAAARRALVWLTRHPAGFPVVLWLMLLLEERSLEVSRRCLRLAEEDLDPLYRQVYRAHLRDEVLHVEIDRHLLEHLYQRRGVLLRRSNAALLGWVLRAFFVRPVGTAVRILDLLIGEFPELAPRRRRMAAALAALGHDAAYQEMMFSRRVTPIAFDLFDRCPELHRLAAVLPAYRPGADSSERAESAERRTP